MIGQMLHEMLSKVLSFNIYWINIHLDFIVLNFEYLYKIIILRRIFSYNYLCRVVLKLSWYSKGQDFTNGISVFNHQFVNHKILKNKDITDMQNTQKLFLSKYTSQHLLSLSNQCECICSKIASITEERISRKGGINTFCILLQQNSDKNIVTECQNSFDYNFNFKFIVHKIVKVMMSR